MMKYIKLSFFLICLIGAVKFFGQTSKPRINRDYVPNGETARKIAEAVWLPIYGVEIYEDTPFVATLKDSIWIVEGTLHATLGGVPYIEIQKKDCKVLRVMHGK